MGDGMNNENGLTPSQLAERNATLVTEIEKCRELSGCPAGVDLQDWVKQLAAENVGLKASIPPLKMINDVTDSWDDVSLAEEVGFNLAISAIMKNLPDTPATDRIVAGIKAAIEYPKNNSSSKGWTIDPEFLGRVVERAGTFYGYHLGLEEAESALLAGLDLLREGAK